jgi:hypothetical protein
MPLMGTFREYPKLTDKTALLRLIAILKHRLNATNYYFEKPPGPHSIADRWNWAASAALFNSYSMVNTLLTCPY